MADGLNPSIPDPNPTVEILDFWTCLFLDPPLGPWELPTPPKLPPTTTPHPGNITGGGGGVGNITTTANFTNLVFYECRAYGKYFLTVDPKKVFTNAHYICVGIFLVTLVVGVVGMVSNILNILILPKSQKGSSLKDLLVILAIVEWIACCATVAFSYLIVCILENLNRSKAVYQWFRVINILYALGRTGSIYLTILITIERYLVVAFPTRAKVWLTTTRSRILAVLVGALTVLLNASIIFNAVVSTVEENDVFPPHTHVENFPYIFKDSHFTNYELQEVLIVMNYVAPLPLLLFFNILLYKSIHDWTQTRVQSTGTRRREINAAKMFTVVVFILFVCHTGSCFVFFISRFKMLIFRELILLQLLCVVISTSVNFSAYYAFSQSFKTEFRNLRATIKQQKLCSFNV